MDWRPIAHRGGWALGHGMTLGRTTPSASAWRKLPVAHGASHPRHGRRRRQTPGSAQHDTPSSAVAWAVPYTVACATSSTPTTGAKDGARSSRLLSRSNSSRWSHDAGPPRRLTIGGPTSAGAMSHHDVVERAGMSMASGNGRFSTTVGVHGERCSVRSPLAQARLEGASACVAAHFDGAHLCSSGS